jgi:hypothetical protein
VFRPLPGSSLVSGEPTTFTLPNVEDVSILLLLLFLF